MENAASVHLFDGLEKEQINRILAAATRRRYKSSDALIRAEMPATRLLLLKTGSANYYITTEKGQQILMRRFGPGDPIGIAAFLSKPVGYLGTASAVGEVEAFAWEHRSIQQLAEEYPKLPQNAFRLALHYIALYAKRHIALVTDKAQERLAYALTDVASRTGNVRNSGVEVDIRNTDLAALADVSFFTVSRLLNKWENSGLVEKSRGKVLIRCPEKQLAEGTVMDDRPALSA